MEVVTKNVTGLRDAIPGRRSFSQSTSRLQMMLLLEQIPQTAPARPHIQRGVDQLLKSGYGT